MACRRAEDHGEDGCLGKYGLGARPALLKLAVDPCARLRLVASFDLLPRELVRPRIFRPSQLHTTRRALTKRIFVSLIQVIRSHKPGEPGALFLPPRASSFLLVYFTPSRVLRLAPRSDLFAKT